MNSLAHIATIGCHLLVIKSEQVLVVVLGLTPTFKIVLETEVRFVTAVTAGSSVKFMPAM